MQEYKLFFVSFLEEMKNVGKRIFFIFFLQEEWSLPYTHNAPLCVRGFPIFPHGEHTHVHARTYTHTQHAQTQHIHTQKTHTHIQRGGLANGWH